MEMSDAIWLVIGLAFMGLIAAFFLLGFRDPHRHDPRIAEIESKSNSGWTASSGTHHGSDGSSGAGGGGGDGGAS